jgi:histidine triad (HIT) family protein
MKCIFCELNPTEVGGVVAENAWCLCLGPLDQDPALQGSLVIVPKAHRQTVFDLTAEEWTATRELVLFARQHLAELYEPEGFNVGWNCGEVGGQSIPHAHLHVMPRFADEPLAGKGIRYHLKSRANRRPGRK